MDRCLLECFSSKSNSSIVILTFPAASSQIFMYGGEGTVEVG